MTNIEDFDTLSDAARVWVYAFSKPLSDAQISIVNKTLEEFVTSWSSHGENVRGGYTLIENYFAILAVENAEMVSGCSIDSSVKVFKSLKVSSGIDALNKNLIYVNIDSGIRVTDRNNFINNVRDGIFGDETIVYDTTIQTMGDFRNGNFRKTLKDSWHAKLI